MSPFHTQQDKCKNCGHRIYYQYDKWEHFTRYYKPHGYPYTTIKCHANVTDPDWAQKQGGPTTCRCESPKPSHSSTEEATPI